MNNLLNRFLTYVSFDTRSNPSSETCPSTAKQFDLLNHLAKEMRSIGIEDASVDANGYVMGTIPASQGCEDRPAIGLIAHVDTSPDMTGTDVRPVITDNYDGGDLVLGNNTVLSPKDFPELADLRGHTLITADGRTLLGADDKAGIAEIMTAAEILLRDDSISHGRIRIAFTSDEEIGRGTDFFDISAFGVDFAYTVDGGAEGELEYENFNAAKAKVDLFGRGIHPGYAKDKMINALHLAMEFDASLPLNERPECTEGYEGFYHLHSFNGTVEHASMEYLIRDHSREMFDSKKARMEFVAEKISKKYGKNTIVLTMEDQYYNMREVIERHPEVIEKAKNAMIAAGVTPVIRPVRGGTDGARLSLMGLPCPNLFTGGMNFHGRFEYCSLNQMKKAVETLLNLAAEWAKG